MNKSNEKNVSSSISSSSVSKVSKDLTKRKRDDEEKVLIEVGMRVKVKFDDGEYYEGSVTKVKKDEAVFKISVNYDDGEEEECIWPDDDIVIEGMKMVEKKTKKIDREDRSGGNGMDRIELVREKKTKKKKKDWGR